MDNLKDKIWLTSRSRVYAEKRLRLYNLTFQALLTYMSVLMIGASVFSDELRVTVQYFDKIRICLSVSLLVVSLVIVASRFSENANMYRKCYLELDNLYLNFEKEPNPGQKYQEILFDSPNHADRDYENMVISRTLVENKTLNSGKESIKWTWGMVAAKAGRWILYWGLVLSIPVVITWFLVAPLLERTGG